MKKYFLYILILSIFSPYFLNAQNSIQNLPQEVQNLLNTDPEISNELEKTYNSQIDTFNTGIEEQISFSATPSVPRPGQLVTATIASYSSDLNRLQISWYINNVLVKKEIGATKHQFTVGKLGEQTNIRIVIQKSNGDILEKKYSFRPAEVDLIYESQTFTHNMYEGKTVFTKESPVKIFAIPQVLNGNGQKISPSNLVYKWYLNGSVVQNQSGYGKQTFYYDSNVLTSSFRVGVEVSTLEQGAVANASITITPQTPEVVLYEKNPTLGTLYNKAITDSFSINIPEVEFEAVPYFFNKELVLNKSTNYSWNLNGTKINSPNKNSIIFRNEKNEVGKSTIGVDISNTTLLQKASSVFNLVFGEVNTNDFQF